MKCDKGAVWDQRDRGLDYFPQGVPGEGVEGFRSIAPPGKRPARGQAGRCVQGEQDAQGAGACFSMEEASLPTATLATTLQ